MKKKIICALLVIVMVIGCVSVLGSCNEDDPPEKCDTCEDKNGDGKCDVCGSEVSGNKVPPHKHKDSDNDGVCDFEGCTEAVTPGGGGGEDPEDDFEADWDKVNFIYKMPGDTVGGELPAQCERYLAGSYSGTKDDIDSLVFDRNEDAKTYANVGEIDYQYYPDKVEFGWGHVVDNICTEISTGKAETLPDMYVQVIYDMVGASLHSNTFANLYAAQRDSDKDGNYENYLPLTTFRDKADAQDFDEERDGMGYMYEYMTTLSLSRNKMYLLASDYYIDLIRAFYVMPVNKTLLEQVGQDRTLCPEDVCGDDGEYTIEDFYNEVYEGKWTYSRLQQFAEAVYSDDENQGAAGLDDTIGLALQVGGLTTSGMLYSSNCTIIERKSVYKDGKQDWEYTYPVENENLLTLVENLTALMDKTGVIAVSYSEADKNAVPGAKNAQECIEIKFSQNKILFGNVIMVGAFENSAYQDMKDKGGFGLVPVPSYEATADDGYFTQIHNVGRIGAICAKTLKFEQVTAYLHFQSTNSNDVLETYYRYKLQYSILADSSGSAEATVLMMDFIRNNVRTAFDKTWEDAMGLYEQKEDERWNSILIAGKFKVPDFETKYDDLVGVKQTRLDNLVSYYDQLGD